MYSPAFRTYLEEVFGTDGAGKVMRALECPPSVSVRLNPAKSWLVEGTPVSRDACLPDAADAETADFRQTGTADIKDAETADIAGAETAGRVPWNRFGLFLRERPVFTLDPLFHAGAYYVQDSSSMFVGFVFRQVLKRMSEDGTLPQERNLRVLDLCAAPGGKTTDLAASLREALGDRFLLVSNEVMKNRAGVLADNVALWGDPNVAVTSADPAAFSRLSGFFDIILADVPCSGEGMFRKDAEAAAQWSEETVELCAARQRRIVADVWPALTGNGILLYSTCTFNRHENDGNAAWISSELRAAVLDLGCPFGGPVHTEQGYSLAPGFVPGEGQYCAVLKKDGENAGKRRPAGRDTKDRGQKSRNPQASGKNTEKEISALLSVPSVLRSRGEILTAVPMRIHGDLSFLESSVKTLSAGVAVGTLKGNRLVPDADLALSQLLREGAFPDVALDRQTALEYLHRDAIRLPEGAETGFCTVSWRGLRLGFVKNLGARCNSLHPMRRRILMDVRDK